MMRGRADRGHRVAVFVAAYALLGAGLLHGCSSSSHSSGVGAVGDAATAADATLDAALDAPEDAEPDSPNTINGVCAFDNNVWYCGSGYGTFAACPGAGYPNTNTPCDFDAGFCLGCMNGVAMSFGWRVGSSCNH
jgi:hypothetical protein